MAAFLNDLRYAGRTLRRSPGFALLAIGIMALGIGANTAVFSIVNGVLLKPLPYPGADRIVSLHTVYLMDGAKSGWSRSPIIATGGTRVRRSRPSPAIGAAVKRPQLGPTAEYTRSATVDVDFFRVFGVQPILGRTFTRDETVPGTGRVVVISHAYWQSRFGGDPGVLNRTVRAGLTERAIVGVMPPGFQFPERDGGVGTADHERNEPDRAQFQRGRAAQA